MRTLRVRSVTWEAQDILSFELVDPNGGELPLVEAGGPEVVGGVAQALQQVGGTQLE